MSFKVTHISSSVLQLGCGRVITINTGCALPGRLLLKGIARPDGGVMRSTECPCKFILKRVVDRHIRRTGRRPRSRVWIRIQRNQRSGERDRPRAGSTVGRAERDDQREPDGVLGPRHDGEDRRSGGPPQRTDQRAGLHQQLRLGARRRIECRARIADLAQARQRRLGAMFRISTAYVFFDACNYNLTSVPGLSTVYQRSLRSQQRNTGR